MERKKWAGVPTAVLALVWAAMTVAGPVLGKEFFARHATFGPIYGWTWIGLILVATAMAVRDLVGLERRHRLREKVRQLMRRKFSHHRWVN
ncbi:MAG: hypothetical protein HY978_04460 [Candidatus Liptonbacteria bacterium]|nr:hypothetical protein [Candidatus Liptonbacteria bacterium]